MIQTQNMKNINNIEHFLKIILIFIESWTLYKIKEMSNYTILIKKHNYYDVSRYSESSM